MAVLGHDIAAALPALRAQAESLLTDVCSLEARTGRTVDAATGARTDVWTAYAVDVPCRVRTLLGELVAEAGGSQVTAQRMTVAVPMWVEGIEVGHRLVVSVSDDVTVIGRPLYVRAVPRGSHLVLRRLSVTDVQE